MIPGLDDPSFKYTPSYSTDLRETFRRVREEIQNRKTGENKMKFETRKVFLLDNVKHDFESVAISDWSIKDSDYLLIGTGSVIFTPVNPDSAMKAQKVLALINKREAAEASLTEIDQQLIALRRVK